MTFTIETPAGILQLDEKGGFSGFTGYDEDEAVEGILGRWAADASLSVEAARFFVKGLRRLLEEAGIDLKAYVEIRRRVAFKVAERLLQSMPGADEPIIQAVAILETASQTIGLLVSRLISMCAAYGRAIEAGNGKADVAELLEAAASIPSPFVHGLTAQIGEMMEYRASVESELEELMKARAPNVAGVLGPLLGAKLISSARGLEQLARMPASRIQVLGADRAMFRHLRERGAPPKHGLIFQHPAISRSPWWQRGKIARSLAAKTAIAARLDAYSGEDRSEELKEAFLRRYEAVKKTCQEEPARMRIIRTQKRKGRTRRRRG
ncbi:MAG: hypothetical protein D6733_03185 [Methanobacteriota archaeon]|nr:MAG: hypothetical protein D6733_03185 [Euryarchaeota archaeon]